MNKGLRNFVFALVVVSNYSALASAEDIVNPFKGLRAADALRPGEKLTLTREDLVNLVGEEKANAIFSDAQGLLKKYEDDRFWNSVHYGIVIVLSVTLWFVYKNFFKKS